MTSRRRSGNRTASADRGQTSFDFLIGMGVFLLAVIFVLSMVPGMLDPFDTDQERTLVADRVASQLADGMFGGIDRVGVLNQTCTTVFFNSSLVGSGSSCPIPYDDSIDNLADRLGVDDRYAINVTIERDITADAGTEIVCWDDGVIACPGPTRLAEGTDPPTNTGSVITARRTVSLDGIDLTVVVRVW